MYQKEKCHGDVLFMKFKKKWDISNFNFTILQNIDNISVKSVN